MVRSPRGQDMSEAAEVPCFVEPREEENEGGFLEAYSLLTREADEQHWSILFGTATETNKTQDKVVEQKSSNKKNGKES